MVAAIGKSTVGAACCIAAVAFGAWAVPLSHMGAGSHNERSAVLSENATDGVMTASLRARSRAAILRDTNVTNGGTRPTSAYRRVLQHIGAARIGWVPMRETPRFAAMTPAPGGTVRIEDNQVTMPLSAAGPRYAAAAGGY